MTARLTLVRHARPAGSWGTDPDPGLDDIGAAQAAALVRMFDGLAPQPIVVSPLRRTRETAAPLAAAWDREVVVEPGVGELVAPADPDPDHATWLRALMRGRGADAPDVMGPFRARVLGAIHALRTDTVVVSHFLAINAVVGAATGDDRVVCFAPDHCSRTTVEWDGSVLTVAELGVTGDGSARL